MAIKTCNRLAVSVNPSPSILTACVKNSTVSVSTLKFQTPAESNKQILRYVKAHDCYMGDEEVVQRLVFSIQKHTANDGTVVSPVELPSPSSYSLRCPCEFPSWTGFPPATSGIWLTSPSDKSQGPARNADRREHAEKNESSPGITLIFSSIKTWKRDHELPLVGSGTTNQQNIPF